MRNLVIVLIAIGSLCLGCSNDKGDGGTDSGTDGGLDASTLDAEDFGESDTGSPDAMLDQGANADAEPDMLPDAGGERGSVDLVWKVSGFDDTGDGCEAIDTATVELVAQARGAAGGEPIVSEPLDCADAAATVPLPVGDYDIRLDALDSDDRLLARSRTESVALSAEGDVAAPAEFAFMSGTFELSWELTEDGTGSPLTCEEAGVARIAVESTLADGSATLDDIFPCPDEVSSGELVVEPLPVGEYDVAVSMLDAGDNEVDRTTVQENIPTHGSVVNLGVFEFVLAP